MLVSSETQKNHTSPTNEKSCTTEKESFNDVLWVVTGTWRFPYKSLIYRSQPYKFRYGIKDHFSNQYRQEAGNGVGGVVGSYGGGFTDARGIARVVVANPIIGYEGLGLGPRYGGILYDGAYRGLDFDRRYRYYSLDNLGYGYGSVLEYTGLLGGYNGIVNYGSPLLGGSIRGYDSRFANLA
ncbi:cuticle protein 16.8 [Trichonephila clavipes]|nr:cuticle protein 16.8 [Trichonephila clavipes]